MVQLATQLVQRQSSKYDVADLEDRYETRSRAMLDAKLKGEGIEVAEPEEPDARTSSTYGGAEEEPGPREAGGEEGRTGKKARAPDRKQSALKLPIQAGKPPAEYKPAAQATTGPSRKRA